MNCPRCQHAIPADAPGALCGRCLLGLGLEPPLPRRFCNYELLARIGSGGMGVIFSARESNPDRLVALKMIQSGQRATPEERERFRREAQHASQLDHPHIVTIFRVSEPDEPAYYTMRLITGGTLERTRCAPRRAAQLIATVARAVHHGHVRGILHRDLKPANILLDEDGQPHVADFGVASRLGDGEEDDGIPGTPHYMSPEQAEPGRRQLTTKSDVYSLGAVLLELLTGQPPFDGATAEDVLAKLRTLAPPSPRSLDPGIDRDLEAICLQCLEKDPEARPSASQLADELERYLRWEPVTPRPIGRAARTVSWARRHPAAAGFAATATLAVLTLAMATVSIVRAQEVERRQDVLKTNAFAARSLAGLALFQLSQTVQVVEQLAADPVMIARLGAPAGRFDPAQERLGSSLGFITLSIRNAEGFPVARWPAPPDESYFRLWYGWTDHFKGAKERGERGVRQGYIGRPSQSEVTGNYKFSISAPMYGPDGAWIGVIYASFATDSLFLNHTLEPGDSRATAALLARVDNDRTHQTDPLTTGFMIVAHAALEQGTGTEVSSPVLESMALPNPRAHQLTLAEAQAILIDDDYRDPVPGFGGRWLAGFAPVGNTGYVMVVQTRYAAIVEPDWTLFWRLVKWVGVPLLVGGLAINLLLFFFRRRPA